MVLLAVGIAALVLTVVAMAIGIAGARRQPRRRRSRKWMSAGGLVIDGRGRLALVRQRNRRGRWHWTLPKGRIDRGETVEAAALREVYEESGLRARILRPIVLHEAAGLLRSRRDLRVLRQLVEMRTGVVSIAARN